jgi:surface protein
LTGTKGWTIVNDVSSNVCDEFVTIWDLSISGSNANQLRILTGNSGTVSYSWEEVSPGTADGSGTFTTTGANVAQTISGLPTGATIRLSISPTNLTRFAVTTSGGADKSRLLDVEQWGSTAWGNLENAFISTDLTNISAIGIPNLSSITKLENMFEGCRKLLNIPNIGSWNVSTATTMTSMFKDCYKFNQDISGWNTANVTTMQNMFGSARDFNQNLGSWTLKSNVNLNGMLSNCGMDCDNYSATLIGWSTQSTTGRTLGATGRKYANGLAARATLTGTKSWTITGDAIGTCSAPTVPNQQSPFTIIDFGGFTKNDIVNLEWIVTDENDLSRYDVYSSTDGINFSLCGSVTATMAERGLKTYQFQDLSNKAALVYYRLKAINNDETGEWSSTVAINTNKSVVNKPLKVYPNPATDFINLEFDGIDASNFNVLVMDMSGKVVYKLDGVQTAINQYTLALNGIESGMYIVQLSDKLGNTTINRFSINQ